jgi:predicted RNA-binding Zn-ribbon protein involved in translation (DUF1610 family)
MEDGMAGLGTARVLGCPACGEIVAIGVNTVRTTRCLYLDCPSCGAVSLMEQGGEPMVVDFAPRHGLTA